MSAKILVVDPSLLDRKRMTTVLQAAGHQTVEFETAAEVRQAVSQMPPGSIKLVLTEWQLAGEDAMAWVAWLQESLPSTPVVVVTAQPSRETIVVAVQHGVATMVAKPFGGEMLLRRVTETLAESEVVRQGEEGQVSWRVQEYLRRELKRAGRSARAVSVIVVGLDDVPSENPAIGAIARVVRESDLVSRLDHGRLIVILPETDRVGNAVVEAKLWQLLGELQRPAPDRPAQITGFATGTATYPDDGLSEEALIAAAIARLRPPVQEQRGLF